MTSITHILEYIGNSLNPIVIKELRQAVQGKFLAAVLLIFLGIQLLTVGLFLTNESVSWSFDAGRNIFKTLASMLLVICLILVPAYTGLRLAIERSDANVDLLFITTLRPRLHHLGQILRRPSFHCSPLWRLHAVHYINVFAAGNRFAIDFCIARSEFHRGRRGYPVHNSPRLSSRESGI